MCTQYCNAGFLDWLSINMYAARGWTKIDTVQLCSYLQCHIIKLTVNIVTVSCDDRQA